MGCFKIPLGLCHEIESLVKKFFWGQRGDHRKIHWVRWDELTKSKMVGGMGFHDLALHNDSLLAKQAWRLLHNHSSLFYKVFKARFFPFPHCSIMEAMDSRSASYAWRSILKGRDVLQRGVRWRVGNGKSIKIWQDYWLPRKHPPQVLSYPLESMEKENAIVSTLINAGTRQWNEELIDGIFALEEAALIKKIPLGRTESNDVLMWPYSPDGRYSCKLGYRFLKEAADMELSSRNTEADTKLWKGIWSLRVPNKVKNLLWCACRDALPTRANLVRRTIIDDPLCARCQDVHETPLHAFWLCKELDLVWDSSDSWSFRRRVHFLDFKELLSWIILQQRHTELFAWMVWTIWSQRNKVRLH